MSDIIAREPRVLWQGLLLLRMERENSTNSPAFRIVYSGISFGGIDEFTSNTPYDDDDREADELYKMVDERMAERRKDKVDDIKEKRFAELDREHMDVKRQFEDLKVGSFPACDRREV